MIKTELTEIREKLSLTKKELAEKLGTTAMMLGRYEKGSCAIPEEIMEKAKTLLAPPPTSQVDEVEVADLVKSLRSTLGLSRAAFAKMIGVSGSAVANYENGKSQPKEGILEKIKALQAEGTKDEEITAPAEETTSAVDEKKEEAAPTVEEEATALTVDEEKPKKQKASSKNTTSILIQSQMGGSISTDEVLSRIPDDCDTVYIKPEENAAYWVKGEESGVVNLW